MSQTSRRGSLLGADRPRVELVPPARDSLGLEAVELAGQAGLQLEGWQRDGVIAMMSIDAAGRWTCPEYAEWVGRQEGKTVGLGLPRALAGFLLLGESRILWSAQQYKTSVEAWEAARLALVTLGERTGVRQVVVGGMQITIVDKHGEKGFRIPETGQRWIFAARSKDSGRGFAGDLNVIDEAYAFSRAHQSALAPTVIAKPNGQIVYLSSPPLDGRTGAPMYQLKERAERRDVRLGLRDWGLGECLDDVMRLPEVERAQVLDDRARWAAAAPALGRGRVTVEAIAQMRASMSDEDFGREVLGMWPRQLSEGSGWSVIGQQMWMAAGGAEGRPDGMVALGVCGAWPDAATASIAVGGHLDGRRVGQVIAHRPGTGWVVERVKELSDRWDVGAVVVDRRGPVGHLLEAFDAAGVDVVEPSGPDVADAAVQLLDAVKAGEFRHYDQAELDAAVAAAQKRLMGDKWAYARRGEVDISPLTAVSLAVWGLGASAPLPLFGMV